MPKKQRRNVSAVRTAAPTTAADRPYTASAPTRSSYAQEFNPDYSQVVHDLKRIGIMAGSFIAILVVLSFFLR